VDFFDELDKAFDNMLVESDAVEAENPMPEVEVHHDLEHLKDAIAQEKLIPISALGELLPKTSRRLLVPALAGALNHLKSLEQDGPQKEMVQSLSDLLRTGKGRLRIQLPVPILSRITEFIYQLAGDPDNGAVVEVAELLKGCGSANRETIQTLFESGLWSASILKSAPMEEVLHITHLPESLILPIKSKLQGG